MGPASKTTTGGGGGQDQDGPIIFGPDPGPRKPRIVDILRVRRLGVVGEDEGGDPFGDANG